jgi:hypothetical protein
LIPSIHIEYVKFLGFFNEFPEYSNKQPIVYIDHKVELDNGKVSLIQNMTLKEKLILIRNTPRLKNHLSDEISDAMNQTRYRQSMPETLKWIESKKAYGASEKVRIMNTGLIYYANPLSLRKLVDEVYLTIKTLNQPECQIIWAILSQPFEDVIQRVDWSEI